MDKHPTTRRQWITATARWGALGAVAAAWLRVSTGDSRLSEQTCIDLKGRTGCQSCGLFTNCGLPRALSVKHFLQERADERNS
jgi:hypothetical protein